MISLDALISGNIKYIICSLSNNSRQISLEMKVHGSGVLIAKDTFERWSYSYLSVCFFGIISFNGEILRVFLFEIQNPCMSNLKPRQVVTIYCFLILMFWNILHKEVLSNLDSLSVTSNIKRMVLFLIVQNLVFSKTE